LIAGQDMTTASAREVREAGVSHIPEDRNERGMVGEYSTAMNSILGDYHKAPFSNKLGFLNERLLEDHATRLVEDYDVRPRSIDLPSSNYSGGNAQKLIVAREIERNPSILIAAQPTRGVDIGAIEFIHKRIIEMRDAGKAVLLVSVELEEVLSVSDRILVMCDGEITGEVQASEADEKMLGLLMTSNAA